MYIPSSIYDARSLVPACRLTKVFYIMQNSCLGSMRVMPIEYIEVTTLRKCAVGSRMSLSVSLTFHCNLSENPVRDTENANLCYKLHRKLQEGSTACPLPKSTLVIPNESGNIRKVEIHLQRFRFGLHRGSRANDNLVQACAAATCRK